MKHIHAFFSNLGLKISHEASVLEAEAADLFEKMLVDQINDPVKRAALIAKIEILVAAAVKVAPLL